MSRYDSFYYPPYVSVAEKKERNAKMAAKLAKKNPDLKPVILAGSKIATTFWGKAWCDNVESYRDYENRLPRGRSYVRAGAIVDLQISAGRVDALVAGSASSPYRIVINIKPLAKSKWESLKAKCVGKISSLLALAQGKLPPEILKEFCDRESGLFPSPQEIKTECSCPDWAGLCKHLAAVFYGIGARLDENPRLFFTLRGIDENELVGDRVVDTLTAGVTPEIAPENLENVFGMQFDSIPDTKPVKVRIRTGKKPASTVLVPPDWTPERIRALRFELGLDQTAFGKLCSVSQNIVSLLEHGKYTVSDRIRRHLTELADAKSATGEAAPPKSWDADRITRLREKLALSRLEFGKRLGISGQTIANWEKGRTAVREIYFKKLAKLEK